jgi:hypothetical protein
MEVKTIMRLSVMGLLLGGAALHSSSAAFAEEVYSARVVDNRGGRRDTVRLIVTIEELSTEEDVARLQKALDEEGSEGLFQALRQMEKGMAEIPEAGPPQRINHVRVIPVQNGRQVIIVTEHPLYLPGAAPAPTSRDTIGYIQLELNNQDKGWGRLVEAVGVRITDEGRLHIEASGAAPIQLKDARRDR